MGPIRILFLSDTHLGFDLPMRPRIRRRRRGHDFFGNFIRALQPALQDEVDCVVHGGDLFYRSKVPLNLVEAAAAPLKAVANLGLPVFVVPGNHERAAIPHAACLRHPNIFVFDQPQSYQLEVHGLRLAVAGFPFVRKGVRRKFLQLTAATGWRALKADAAILCLHQSVDGARVGPGNYMFRHAADVIDAAAIPPGFIAVLAGHIHRHQVLTHDLTGRRMTAPVFYPGSIERTSYAEKDESKGFLTLELESSAAGRSRLRRWKFHELPARPMVRAALHVDKMAAVGLTAAVRAVIDNVAADAVVQLCLTGRPEKSAAACVTAAALRELAPATMNIEAVWPERRFRENKDRSLSTGSPAPKAPAPHPRPFQTRLFEDP